MKGSCMRSASLGCVVMTLLLAFSQRAHAYSWLTSGFLAFGDLYHVPSNHLPVAPSPPYPTKLILRLG